MDYGIIRSIKSGISFFKAKTSTYSVSIVPPSSEPTANRTLTLPSDRSGTIVIQDAFAVLTDAATITWDVSTGLNKTVTLGGNRTLAITNASSGMYGTLIVTQDATGSRTLTLPSGSKTQSGYALSTAASSIDILSFTYNGTNYFWTIGKAYT